MERLLRLPFMALTLLLAGIACGPPDDEDSGGDEADTVPHVDPQTCDVAEVRVNGPDPVHVGDTATVFLWCDDVLMTGATHINIDPTDFATIEDNNLTFLMAGTGTLEIQVGRFIGTTDITVEE